MAGIGLEDDEIGELQSMGEDDVLKPELIFPDLDQSNIHKVGSKIRIKLVNLSPACPADVTLTSCPEGIDIRATEEDDGPSAKGFELTPQRYGTFKLMSRLLTERGSDSNILFIVPMMQLEKRINCSPHFQLPRSMVVLGAGTVIVADGIRRQIIKMDLNNPRENQCFEPPPCLERQFSPIGLAIKEDNEVYVTDLENKCVHVYHGPSNKFLESFGNRFLKRPTGICIDKDGYIFIADFILNKILQFDGNYQLIEEDCGGDLNHPQLMTINHQQNGTSSLLVADRNNHRIVVFLVRGREAPDGCEEHGKEMTCMRSIDLSFNGIPILPFSVVCEEMSDHIFVAGQMDDQQKEGVILFVDGNTNTHSDIPERKHAFYERLRNPGGMCLIPASARPGEKTHLLVTDMRGKNATSCINSFIL